MIENVGIGETEDTKEGGQKYTCRDYIRDNYICKIKQYDKSLIATLLVEGKNSLSTKVAKYLKGLGNSDLELSTYLLNKGIFPPINKRSSSTRNILSIIKDAKRNFLKTEIELVENFEKVKAEVDDRTLAIVLTNQHTNRGADKEGCYNFECLSENFEFRSLLD